MAGIEDARRSEPTNLAKQKAARAAAKAKALKVVRSKKPPPNPFAIKPSPSPLAPPVTPPPSYVPTSVSDASDRAEPSNATKVAVIRSAEDAIPPWELKKTPSSPKTTVPPFRKGYGPPPPGKSPFQAVLDQRYQAAIAAPVVRKARDELKKTMSPQRRAELINQQRAIQRAQDKADAAFAATIARGPAGSDVSFLTPDIGGVVDAARSAYGAVEKVAQGNPFTNPAVIRSQAQTALDLGKRYGPVGAGVVKSRFQHVLDAAQAVYEGDPTAVATSLSQQRSGLGPQPEDVARAGQAVGKVLAGGGAAVPGIARHPLRAVQETIDFIRGGGQAAVALSLIWTLPRSQREAVFEGLVKETIKDIEAKYGSGATWADVVRGGFNEPIPYLANALATVAAPIKAVSILRYMRGGATLEQARILSRDPARIDEFPNVDQSLAVTRKLTVRGKETAPFTVDAPQSISPLMRGVQKATDVASGAIENVPVARRLPITQTKRALRIQARTNRRHIQQTMAEGAALYKEVENYLGERPEHAARLFYGLQKPADMTEEAWLVALQADIARMLGGRPMPGKGASPAEIKMQRKLDRFKANVDKAAREQMYAKVEDVHVEQQRLAHSLVNLNKDLKLARERQRQIAARTDMDPAAQAAALEAATADVKQVEGWRKTTKELLDDLTVDRPPIEDATRTEIADTMRAAPNISDDEIEGVLAVTDTLAHRWGRANDRDPAEFYSDPTGLGVAGARFIEHEADLPEGSLTQKIRPKEREAYTPEHKKSVDRLYAAETRYQETEDRRSIENKAINERRKANKERKKKGEKPLPPYKRDPELEAIAEELRASQEQELYDRLWYGSNTYKQGDDFPSNPERAALASDLVEHRGSRTGALPPGVTEPRQLEQLMALLEELRARGKKARFWYRNSGRAILKMAGGDKKVAANIAQLVAIYSPQKAVIPNLSEAIKAYQSWKATGHVSNGQEWQMDAAENVLEGRGGWDGRKTNNFYGNLLQWIDKKAFKAEGFTGDEVTADMWMARVFGYLQKNVSGGRYDVVEQAVRQLAKEQGWRPQEAQAAIWTAIKDLSDDVSANVDFATAVSRHEGQINYELAPGKFTGPFKETYESWEPETQQAFLNANMPLVDAFLDKTGVLHRGPSEHGPGVYENQAAPGARTRIYTSGAAYKVGRDERTLFNFVTASIGRATLQDAVPWVRGFHASTKGHANTMWVDLGRAATPDEALQVYRILNPDPENEQFLVVHAGNEGLLLRKGPWIKNEDFPNYGQGKVKYPASFQGRAHAAAKSVFGEEVRLSTHVSDGEMPENNWQKGSTDYDAIIDRSLAARARAESRSRKADDPGIAAETVRLRGAADWLARETEQLRHEFTADPGAATARYGVKRNDEPASDGSPPDAAGPRGPPRVLLQREGPGTPSWWDEPSENRFFKGSKGEEIMDWLDRHDVPQNPDGTYRFYHGTPKAEGRGTALRADSLLETDPKAAALFAAHNRGLDPETDINVITLDLHPWEIKTGHWAALRNDRPDGGWSDADEIARFGHQFGEDIAKRAQDMRSRAAGLGHLYGEGDEVVANSGRHFRILARKEMNGERSYRVQQLGGDNPDAVYDIYERGIAHHVDEPPEENTFPEDWLSQRRMNGARQGEVKGAVHFLNTDDGQRFLYLTQHADVSTVLHELIGHGMHQMKAAHPQEFKELERFVGKPLEEWEVDDHERVARLVERYFSSGKAPVPELVETFQQLQVWMRAVRSEAGKSTTVPPELSDLLDAYLGAFDDENVFRVATMMARIPEETRTGRAQALYDFTGEELAALRRRNESRRYNKSIEKLEKDLQALASKADRTDEEQELLIAKHAQLVEMAAAREVAIADREHHLRNRYGEIEDALLTPSDARYESALANMQTLIDMREEVLRSVFGDTYDTTFEKRVDLLADHLADQGLIPPGFQRGTAWYVPHRPQGGGKPARRVAAPAQALEGSTIGKSDTSMLNLHSRNNLIRWQSGDIEADPLVVFEAWQNAQAFLAIHTLKKLMWDIGRKISPYETIPDDVFVINFEGIPVPTLQKRSMQGGTAEVQRVLDAIEGRNPEAMEQALEKYVGEVIMDPETANELKATLGPDVGKLNLKVVDKKIVDGLFRPLRAGSSKASRGFDYANALARWSLIYTNPAYIPFNFLANNLLLFSSRGPAMISDWVSAARYLHKDEAMRIRVGGQVGELPATAAAQVGRGVQRFHEHERKALIKLTTIPDAWPRMVAWVAEAKRMGYRTKAEMNALLDGKTERNRRNRDIVSDRATNIMVDFDRMGDWERQTLTRIFFIWPWIRGATAWPFYYMREYPVRTAVAGNIGMQSEERRKRMMGFPKGGDVRPGYRELFPLERRGQFVDTMNVGPLSPGSTPASFLEFAQSLLHGNVPAEPGDRIIDYVQPVYEMLGHIAMQTTGYGQKASTKDLLFDDLLNFAPFGQLGRQIAQEGKRSKVYNDRDVRDLIERKLLRTFSHETIDLNRLNAFRESQGKKTGSEAVAESVADLTKKARTVGGDTPPQSVQLALKIQQAVIDERERREDIIKKSKSWHPPKPGAEPKLNDTQYADVVYDTISHFYPGVMSGMPRPEEFSKGLRLAYADALLYGNSDEGIDGVLEPLTDYRRELNTALREKKLSGG